MRKVGKNRVAVLGGGVLGCCTALVLAQRGARVTLFDRAAELFSRTSIHNEGRIHFGYVYAGDPTLATAQTMIRGALSFGPFLEKHLDLMPQHFPLSSPTIYLVHANTQRSVDYLFGYFNAVHALIEDGVQGQRSQYFGADLHRAPRKWSSAELEQLFNPARAIAAFDTQEVCIEPYSLAKAFRDRVAATPSIELRLCHTVKSVGGADARLWVISDGPHGVVRDHYDHVVNALWDGRLAIDTTFGISPKRPWLYRFRYGVRFETRSILKVPLSLTIIHGPFGGIACYRNGGMYLNWYPVCRVAYSKSPVPPDRPVYASDPERSWIIRDTVSALSKIIPVVGALNEEELDGASVIGGNIFAWASSDTDDPTSELHQRYDIGVVSAGNYHTVDPGKLSMAPHFAEVCADRILP
jgi:FAD dependent oxidoreductase